MSPESYEQFVVAAQQARREHAAAARAARGRRRSPRRSQRATAALGFRLVEVGLRLAVTSARTPDQAR
jgi:hypothetical protein